MAFEDVDAEYTAVPVRDEEYARVVGEFPIPLPIQFLMGFPPRDLLRPARRTSGWEAPTSTSRRSTSSVPGSR